jgi:glycerophosphoryl diester phosphodiesterase
MKKILLLLLIPIMFANPDSTAQIPESNVYLTNYTISKGSKVIGQLKLKNGEIRSVTLEGENKAVFAIDKSNQLTVKAGKLKGDSKWIDIKLNIETSSGRMQKEFRLVKDEFIHNKVIAHRGAWKNTGVAENSIAALDHAIRLGCEGSEFDVHMSADSLPVVNHDPSIQGISIAKTNSSELLALKLSHGESFPTLENYLKAGLEQNRTKLILEIKPSELGKESSLALTRKIVALVERLHAEGWVDYISFDYDVCTEVMKLAPHAKVAYLKGDKSPAELAAAGFYGFDYHFSVLQKNPTWVSEAKSKKLTVNVWTVNDEAIMKDLLQQNVDFITTNEPELLLPLVR